MLIYLAVDGEVLGNSNLRNQKLRRNIVKMIIILSGVWWSSRYGSGFVIYKLMVRSLNWKLKVY